MGLKSRVVRLKFVELIFESVVRNFTFPAFLKVFLQNFTFPAFLATFAAKSKNKKSLLGTGLVAGYSSDEESSAEEENEEEESSEEEELTEEQLEVKMNEFERRQRALLRKLEERGEDKQQK